MFENRVALFKDLFFRNLLQTTFPYFGNKKRTMFFDTNEPAIKIEYDLNSYGFRGSNFLEPSDILSLGCSQTFGHGLPETDIWPKLFADKINNNYHNLALGGDSIQGQVYKAFQYFKEIGNPKLIIGTFPISRIELPYIKDKFEYQVNLNFPKKEIPNFIHQVFFSSEGNLVKYSKLPHNPREVIPVEVAIFYSFVFIQMLEQYCKTNKIILMWNIYDDDNILDFLKDSVPEVLINYVDFSSLKKFRNECGINNKDISLKKSTCHQDLNNSQNTLFLHAADCDHKNNKQGHWGIHMHSHVADTFYKEYLKRMEK